jgi:hypothetical protein
MEKSRARESEEGIGEERQVESNMAVAFVDRKFFSGEWQAKQL